MVVDCANCPLRKLDTFDRLSGEELVFMQRFKVGELKIDKGTPFLLEGSNSPQLFTALRGMGLRYKYLPNGKRQVVNFVLPGDFLGLQAGVMDEMKHSVEATTPMVLCVFERTSLWSLLRSQPHLAYELTWLAALEEHFLGEVLTSIGQMTAQQRICWGLLRLYRRCEQVGLAKNNMCPLPYRQQDLADAVGLSLVHTNKTLMALKQRQVLAWHEGTLRILDREVMEKIAMFEPDGQRKRPLI